MKEITNILDIEKYISDIEAVIFDLDDTLYSEKEYVRSGFAKIEEYLGFPGIAQEMWTLFESGEKPIDSIVEKYSLGTLKEKMISVYRLQNPDIQLYDGVNEMIERIRKYKKVGIITDGRPEGQRAKIKALGLDVDEIIVTDELGGIEYRKPNEAAFVIMQNRMSVPFNRMVYVGDNLKKDFIAPERLGYSVIHFKNEDGLYYAKD